MNPARRPVKKGKKAPKVLKVQEKPRQVIVMEERAAQRKEKRELLKQRYEEKRQAEINLKKEQEAQKEEEFRLAKEGEKEAKKQVKIDEARKKEVLREQAEDLKMKMIAAEQYYDQQILIKYGIIPLANLMVMARYKQRQAVLQNRKSIQRAFFRQLRNRASLQIAERRHAEMY